MEENRDDFGEDIDIENLAAALGDRESADSLKDIPQTDDGDAFSAAPSETPVFSDEPAASPLSDPPPPESFPEAPAEDSSAAASGESKDGDIDALIKKYEEMPESKKEIAKPKKLSGGKSLPVMPIAAAAGIIVILAVLKFTVFKPVPAVQQLQPSKQPAGQPAGQAQAPAGAAASFDYPGGALLLGETADGIEIKIIETDAAARDIKLFYQKNMTAKGFELAASRKNRRTFNMNFFKGKEDYSVSVVPHEEKNLIIVTRAQ